MRSRAVARGWRVALGLLLALLPPALVAAAAPSPVPSLPASRVFEVVHRPIDEAYRLISPLLSDDAEVRVLRATRRIEVRDQRERLEAVAEALAGFDVAPRRVRLSMRLLKAEKREGGGGSVEAERGVPRDVRELVAYNSFETLGTIELPAEEGQAAGGLLGADDRFRLELRLGAVDRAAGRIPVESLALSRRAQGSDGRAVYRPVFEFKEVLQNGRTRVLLATPSATDRRALFLVLVGTIE